MDGSFRVFLQRKNGPTVWRGEFGAGDGETSALSSSVAKSLVTPGTGVWEGLEWDPKVRYESYPSSPGSDPHGPPLITQDGLISGTVTLTTSVPDVLTHDVTPSRAQGIRTGTSPEVRHSANPMETRELGLGPWAPHCGSIPSLGLLRLEGVCRPAPPPAWPSCVVPVGTGTSLQEVHTVAW